MGDPLTIRDATEHDLPRITELYNALVPTDTVTWRDEPASIDEMAESFRLQHERGNPFLVAELDGEVVGYTTWVAFRGVNTPGYRFTVEHTIHVDRAVHGRGVGRTLLEALLDEARRRGLHVMVAAIDAANTSSIRFHDALGFTLVARMPEVGRKFDRWLDLVLMQRTVDGGGDRTS